MLELAVMNNACASLTGPKPMPERLTVCGPASWLNERLLMASSVGASFTGLTVRRNVVIAVEAPSFTEIVTEAVPN